MTAEIVEVGGRQWVLGMHWRTRDRVPSRAELRKAASGMGAAWVAVRKSADITQTGFCPKLARRIPRKASALAPAIARLHAQPWMGIYKLDDKSFWYVAVRDDYAVLDDGDIVGDAKTITELREKHASYGDWTVIEGNEAEFEALTARADPAASNLLAPHAAPPWLLPAALGVGCVGVAIGLGYWEHARALRAVAEQRARFEASRMRHHMETLSPLVTLSPPDQWLRACQTTVGALPLSSGGWMLADWHCDQRQAHINWKRAVGATVKARPDGDLDLDGEQVRQTIPLPPVRPGSNDAVDGTHGASAFFALVQPIGIKTALHVSAPVASPDGAINKAPHPASGFDVEFDMVEPPSILGWDAVPGLRFSDLALKPGGYHLKGNIYGR